MEKIVGVIYADEERKAYCLENSYVKVADA